MKTIWSIFIFALAINAVVCEDDDEVTWERDERRSTESCRTGFPVFKGSANATFSSKDKICKVDVIGVGCKVSLNCEIDIPGKQGSCDDALKISDGVGGYEEYCGKSSLKNIQPHSDNFKDLFVDASEAKKGTWSCKATCDAGAGTRLPKAGDKKEEFRCVCGLQNKDDRIVGGEDARFNEFPWQTAIVFPGTRSPICGATLINEKFVLTAAHCFYMAGMKNTEIEVLFHAYLLDATEQDNAKDVPLGQDGSTRGSGYNKKSVTDKDENSQRFKVAEIIMHPLFNDRYDYDYAILRLDKKVDLVSADSPTPICLPELGSDLSTRTYEGTKPWVVGWGKPHELAGASTRILQKLEAPIIPLKKCISWVGDVVTPRMLCAGYEAGGKDACTGDSGGPLILKRPNKQWEQIGIVSWGEGCARAKSPGFYSRVTENIQWISHHANTGGIKWCRPKKD